MKITDQQIMDLEVMIEYGKDGNYIGARLALLASGINGDTYTTDKHIARLMIRALWATCKPDDFGRDGKAGEAENRLDAMDGRKRFVWRWRDCWKRPDGKPDGVFKAGGKLCRVESKTGTGDWCTVHTDDFANALAELAEDSGYIRWNTPDFDLFLPSREFYRMLADYNPKKGLATWFNSQLTARKTGGEYTLRMQPYKTSRKKMAYLVQMEAEIGYNWGQFAKFRQFIRNKDL